MIGNVRFHLVRSAVVLLALAIIGSLVAVALLQAPKPSARGVLGPDASAGRPSAAPTSSSVVPQAPYAIGLRQITFVDTSRSIEPPHTKSGRREPRVLRTQLWLPEVNRTVGANMSGQESSTGPFPLLVFAPGFDLFARAYSPIMRGIARKGFVVAAPTFPLTNPETSGGPYEPDMVNQPEDIKFVVSGLLRDSRRPSSFLYGLVDPSLVAIAGQSDGGDTVLASAYDSCCRDRRVRAVVVMSGQRVIPGTYFSKPGPPLLAFQGTADIVNPPIYTKEFFADARHPKFLVWLRGAGHLTPYTMRSGWESIVVKTTVAFLEHYLKGRGSVDAIRKAVAAAPRLASWSR